MSKIEQALGSQKENIPDDLCELLEDDIEELRSKVLNQKQEEMTLEEKIAMLREKRQEEFNWREVEPESS